MGFKGTDRNEVKALIDYTEKLGVPYYIVPTDIGEILFDVRKESNPCSLCSKMRRGALNNKAKEIGANKIALGHHADDVIQTIFLSLFYEGRFSSFAPTAYMDRSGIELIRPFIYVWEKDLKSVVAKLDLPVLNNVCPAKKVIVAVIDTGIISDHEVFDGIELVSPYNVILDSEDVTDDTAPSLKVTESRKYHGTHVTGIVARLVKEFGLESYVSVMPIKAGDAQATFRWDRAVTAIRYAADNGASVINMSFTNELSDKPSASYIQKLNEAVNYAYSKGAICVAAAGNQGRINANSFYPAACEKVIGVMAYNDRNERYSKSTFPKRFLAAVNSFSAPLGSETFA